MTRTWKRIMVNDTTVRVALTFIAWIFCATIAFSDNYTLYYPLSGPDKDHRDDRLHRSGINPCPTVCIRLLHKLLRLQIHILLQSFHPLSAATLQLFSGLQLSVGAASLRFRKTSSGSPDFDHLLIFTISTTVNTIIASITASARITNVSFWTIAWMDASICFCFLFRTFRVGAISRPHKLRINLSPCRCRGSPQQS